METKKEANQSLSSKSKFQPNPNYTNKFYSAENIEMVKRFCLVFKLENFKW
jgi:hypothetical protein